MKPSLFFLFSLCLLLPASSPAHDVFRPLRAPAPPLIDGVLEYNDYRKKLLTDLLVSFTYIPGTVIQLGCGSLNEKVHWEENDYRPDDRFLEMKRGLFFKASYLWRL